MINPSSTTVSVFYAASHSGWNAAVHTGLYSRMGPTWQHPIPQAIIADSGTSVGSPQEPR
jgi:hypothetical protein